MSLLTPFGPLRDIPLDNLEQLKEILIRSDKSRMLEGLVIEAVFNDYLDRLMTQQVHVLPVSLVRTLTIKRRPRTRYVNAWWLWDHSGAGEAATDLSRHLLPASGKDEFLFDCYYDESARDFFIKEWQGRTHIPIQSFMLKSRGYDSPVSECQPARSLTNTARNKLFGQAFLVITVAIFLNMSSCIDCLKIARYSLFSMAFGISTVWRDCPMGRSCSWR